ncbi:XRE family transcriptional regulator [Streptomyces hygroscopicus]|uniref:XRE family transcriptional regulator n=1 Tax=Streptomyces hygroscopicus TaxID=1912 RepID=UPI00202DFFC5|nr:XRE family transcriptional regulator [Streptomyces hygroscopicus]
MGERETWRSDYPLTIPDALLQSEAMQRACATRNFREIFRLVNRRTGSSHAVIASAVGKMTSARVSDIIRGVRGIRGQQVIERVADGFGIPGEMLGLPPRPWEGSPEGIDGISGARRSVGAATNPETKAPSDTSADVRSSIPDTPDSVLLPIVVDGRMVLVPVGRKTLESHEPDGILEKMVFSGSSEGGTPPSMEHEIMSLLSRRALLKGGFSVISLRRVSVEGIEHVAAALDDARRYFDGTVVEYFRSQLETAKCDDGRLGAQKTLPVVLGLLAVIEQQARDVKPAIRRELLSVGADGAEFAGWLYRDAHQPDVAVFWYDRAMEWAQEADDPAMQGYMLLKKSQMAYDDQDAVRMLTLAQAGQHQRWHLPTRVRAELLQQEALGLAMLGEPLTLIEQKLDTSRELLARADGEPSGLGAYFNEHTLLLRNAVSYTEAGKPGIAADLFGEIISAGTLSRRDTGFFNARRAAALALSGEPDEAAEVGTASAEVAQAVQSERTMRVLGEVLQTLSRWRSRPAVRKFREALRVA